MSIRKLNDDEKLDAFDKILLITGHINFQANVVREVLQARRLTVHAIEKNVIEDMESDFFVKMVADTEKFLDEVAANLNKEYEALVDFCNNCDAVSDVDIALGESVYNAMNDMVKVNANNEDAE